MQQETFNALLGSTDLPLCGECMILLKQWAEGEHWMHTNRLAAWHAFEQHLQTCPMQQHSHKDAMDAMEHLVDRIAA